jgi:hypothetical protein
MLAERADLLEVRYALIAVPMLALRAEKHEGDALDSVPMLTGRTYR